MIRIRGEDTGRGWRVGGDGSEGMRVHERYQKLCAGGSLFTHFTTRTAAAAAAVVDNDDDGGDSS